MAVCRYVCICVCPHVCNVIICDALLASGAVHTQDSLLYLEIVTANFSWKPLYYNY